MSRNDNARERTAAAKAVRENREAEERANRASPVVTGEVVLHDETIKPAPTTTDVKTTTKVREYRYPLSMPTGGIKFPGSITFTAYEIYKQQTIPAKFNRITCKRNKRFL